MTYDVLKMGTTPIRTSAVASQLVVMSNRSSAIDETVRQYFNDTLSRARCKELAPDYLEREGGSPADRVSTLVPKERKGPKATTSDRDHKRRRSAGQRDKGTYPHQGRGPNAHPRHRNTLT
jgi:hypothetical protein